MPVGVPRQFDPSGSRYFEMVPRNVDPELVAFQQFFGTVAANPSVELIGIDPVGGYLGIWVRLGDDDEANEDAIYTALSKYHATPGIEDLTPIDLHVVFADERPDAYPSSIQILYRRVRAQSR